MHGFHECVVLCYYDAYVLLCRQYVEPALFTEWVAAIGIKIKQLGRCAKTKRVQSLHLLQHLLLREGVSYKRLA
jgi:hypothetical protein